MLNAGNVPEQRSVLISKVLIKHETKVSTTSSLPYLEWEDCSLFIKLKKEIERQTVWVNELNKAKCTSRTVYLHWQWCIPPSGGSISKVTKRNGCLVHRNFLFKNSGNLPDFYKNSWIPEMDLGFNHLTLKVLILSFYTWLQFMLVSNLMI